MLDYQEDIASDLAVFFRVDDPADLPAPLYFARAMRLGAYAGVMQARLHKLQEEREAAYGGAAAGGVTRVADDEAVLQRLADEGWVDRG